MSIVIITEKKDVADNMAKAYGWGRGQGGYEGSLEGKPVKVVWARGHLLKMMSPDQMNPDLGWDDPLGLAPIPRDVPMEPVEEPGVDYIRTAKALLDNIEKALKSASEVILATDSDREGEYIGWAVLEYLGKHTLPVRRCWLAAGMDEKSIKHALTNLLPSWEKKPLARAAEARARCDWSYMYLVRLMTHYGRKGFLGQHLGTGNGRESTVSVGRVQSSALYMIYKREMELRAFVSKKVFGVVGEFGVGNEGQLLEAEYVPKVTQEVIDSCPAGVLWEPQGLEGEGKLDKPLFVDEDAINAFADRLMLSSSAATVHAYKEGTREQHPPTTFDLVGAKSALSGACKINGEVAQAVIEDLYEQGFISYPRTAHGELPVSLYDPAERDTRLQGVAGISGLGEAANRALAIHGGSDSSYKPFVPKVFVKKKLEHYGLIPSMRAVDDQVLASMSPRKRVGNGIPHTAEHMREAYRLIATRFVQAMLPPVKLATQKITFTVPVADMLGQSESLFVAKAERTLDMGWRGIMDAGGAKAADLPKLVEGQSTPLHICTVTHGFTKAPKRYSEENIERAMQKAAREVDDPELRKYLADGSNKPEGIGTPATRKDIIPTLKVRGYIRADKGGVFFLEPKGEEFIGYQLKHGHEWLYRIETTAQWEGALSDLALLENDAEAMAMRDQFIEGNLQNIEGYINWMNGLYQGQDAVRERAQNQGPSAVTARMKETIKSIADRKKIQVPRGTLSDPVKAKAFLDEHLPKKTEAADGQSVAPSDAQLGFLAKIEAAAGVTATVEERSDRKLLTAFIEKHKGVLDAKAPSEKQISFARSLAAKLPADKQPKPEVFTRLDACRKFIDKHAKR